MEGFGKGGGLFGADQMDILVPRISEKDGDNIETKDIGLVSRLGFGCGGLSGILNAPLSHEDIYGDHHNEIMVGKVFVGLGVIIDSSGIPIMP
ncbi:hypothetical protein SO802_027853, partial [Lithocarpus litseifolius]